VMAATTQGIVDQPVEILQARFGFLRLSPS
jgi:hypothetical protein